MFTKWWTEKSFKTKGLRKAMIPVMLCFVLTFISACALLPEEPEEEELLDITPPRLSQKPEYTVQTDTLETRVRGTGKIMSMQEEKLFFTLEGQNYRVKDVYVSNDERVEAGQLIAELD